MKNSIKSTIKKMESIVDKLNVEIEKREEIFFNRSDNWRESEKGEEFELTTQELETIRDDAENLQDQFQSFLDNL